MTETEVWDRSFQIDSLEAACRFVESVWNDDVGHRPLGVMASAPRMSTASWVTSWWCSLQKFLKMPDSGPGWWPPRNCVSDRSPR